MTPRLATGTAPRLMIGAAHQAALLRAAEAAYPNEFCALLVGRDRGEAEAELTRIVPAENVAAAPRTGFELDPRVLIRTLRTLREAERTGEGNGERLLGHVHSHPDAAAEPSARDRALAHEPGLFWLIVAVEGGKAGAINAFQSVEAADGEGTGAAGRFVSVAIEAGD
jgi:proteasome lid subunit RPN8/RPN11